VDVRIVSATNADLRAEVAAGRFRQDLLFRLNTVEIPLPPLRERREDLPALARSFLSLFASKHRKPVADFAPSALEAMRVYPWPGNVRELEHVVERAVLMAEERQVRPSDLGLSPGSPSVSGVEAMSLEDVETLLIRKALARFDGNVSRAAEFLGLSRSALYRRLQRYGL